MKVKAKEKNGIVKAKVLIKHQNIGPEEAEKKKKEPNFGTTVMQKLGNKNWFMKNEMESGIWYPKEPLLLKFKVPREPKVERSLEVTGTDLKGNTKPKKA